MRAFVKFTRNIDGTAIVLPVDSILGIEAVQDSTYTVVYVDATSRADVDSLPNIFLISETPMKAFELMEFAQIHALQGARTIIEAE
jgi:hypothetical protein